MRRITKSLCLISLSVLPVACTNSGINDAEDSSSRTVGAVARKFIDGHNGFREQKDVWGKYTLDLTFESMLYYDHYSRSDRFLELIEGIMRLRNYLPSDTIPYRNQPFCNISYALYESTGDTSFLPPFISESQKMFKEMNRSVEGAVCFYSGKNPDRCLLIDFIQEYCLRMARTAYHTGDTLLFEECVSQFEIYSEILRDPSTGLYSQGRGWLDDPTELSPGAWSRGHGWLLKGMVGSMKYLPPGSGWHSRLNKLIHELLTVLLPLQDENGMWHVLLNRSFNESYAEVSGTGMIAGYALMAVSLDIPGPGLREQCIIAADKARKGILKYIESDGIIHNASPGPGPLYSETDYLFADPVPGDEHGPQAVIRLFTSFPRE